MPSLTDVYNQLVAINTNLEDLEIQLSELNSGVSYATGALYHLALQDDTMICLLEKIGRILCANLNEAAFQSECLRSLRSSVGDLVQDYESEHPRGAMERQRFEELERRLDKCCPPPEREPVCVWEPCGAPDPLGPPGRDGEIAEEALAKPES